MNKIYLLCLAVLSLIFSCSSRNQATNIATLEGSTMGTFYTVKIIKTDLLQLEINSDSLQHRIDSVLTQINHWMSTYKIDSEIS
jgi:thiamine biosynthesis lipoprotein